MANTRRVIICTEAEHAAIAEALAFRLAGPIEKGPGLPGVRAYTTAEEAVAAAPVADVAVTLTRSEARGLIALAGEGAEGLLTDEGAARGYLGNNMQQDAARRGRDKLIAAAELRSGGVRSPIPGGRR